MGSPVTLTESQKNVLRLYYRRFGTGEIATQLGITSTAVTERLRSARAKLNVSSSAEAARLLYEHETATESEDAFDPSMASGVQNTIESAHRSDVDNISGLSLNLDGETSSTSPRWQMPWRTKTRPKKGMSFAETSLLVLGLTVLILMAMALYLLGVKALSSLV